MPAPAMAPDAGAHVVIVGSAPADPDHVRQVAQGARAVICADGGADAVLAAGIVPALVVGDLDSISPTSKDRLRALGVRIVQHPPEKDQTDLELAVAHAVALGPARLSMLGVLGGRRFDHAMGNVLLLAHPLLREIDARILDADAETLVVGQERTIHGRCGEYVSLIPLTPRVEGVRTEGLRYPLRDEPLVQGSTRGVSNELAAEEATVRVAAGCLLLVHERLRSGESGTS